MSARLTALAVVVCTTVFVTVASVIAHRQSATRDEVAHIAAGVAYAQGDMRLNHEHPPLVKWLAGQALALEPPPALPAHVDVGTQWSFGDEILHRGPPGQALALLGRARMPLVLLAGLCPLLVAVWAFRIAGGWAAVAASVFAACCPLWYAHGSLVTTDAAVSVFTVASALCAHRLASHVERPPAAWTLALAASVALGLASKYSMLVSVAGVGSAAFTAGLATRRWQACWVTWAALLVGSALGVSLAWGWPPSVSVYVAGARTLGFNHLPGYPFYAFGALFYGVGTQPLYFVRALLVKLEWPLLVFAALGLSRLLARAARPSAVARVDVIFLVVVPGTYLVAMSLFAPAIGVRYVLPVLPFAFVVAGVAAAILASSLGGRVALIGAVALEVLALTSALQASPIAWFNGFPCKTGQTPACLDDSNVDWGQSLPALAHYRDARFPNLPIRVFSFVQSPLSAYLPRATEAAPSELLRPYRALYAASLHSLARMPRVSPFVRMQPREVVAGSLAIFDLRAVQMLPAAPR